MKRRTALNWLVVAGVGMAIVACNIKTEYGPTPYIKPKSYSITSKSPLTITTGKVTLTIDQPNLKFLKEQHVTIDYPKEDSLFMDGEVESYDAASQTLVVNVTTIAGDGTYSNWGIIAEPPDLWFDSLLKNTSLPDSLQKAQDSLKSLQAAYVALKFGMFVHFNMSTFTQNNFYSVKGEWGVPNSDPNLFKPGKLDCGQWADVAKSAGCQFMVLTSKHHDGFCLWDSKYTKHDIGSSSWYTASGRDVIKEFADAARAKGLKVGLYYSVWDKTNGSTFRFLKRQLSELLTNYGEITCLWFDGWGWMVPYTPGFVPYDSVKNIVKRLQPKCLLISNNYYKNMTGTEIVEFEIPVVKYPMEGSVNPQEGCESIRNDGCWFWHPLKEADIMPAQTIKDEKTLINSRNATYLLNVPPNPGGLIPQSNADRMKEIGVLLGVR